MSTFTITKKRSNTIYFSTVEDRLSLMNKFVNGENLIVRGNNNYEYHLHLFSLAKEDGSGKRFLFNAVMKKAISGTGLTSTVSSNFTGYIDTQNRSGWIKHIDKIVWNA